MSFTDVVTYSEFIIENQAIFSQAIMMGLIVVGVGCLSGFMIHATVAIFRMISSN